MKNNNGGRMNYTELQMFVNKNMGLLSSQYQKQYRELFGDVKMVYPFNDVSVALPFLLEKNIITIKDISKVTREYTDKEYLYLYDMGNTAFGHWVEKHIRSTSNGIHTSGVRKHDLLGINRQKMVNIEAKGSRAIKGRISDETDSLGNIVCKAASYNDKDSFTFVFDHLKTFNADVFCLVGVWTDNIKYWVIPSSKIVTLHHTHKRDGRTGYMVSMCDSNIDYFKSYEVKKENLYSAIMQSSTGRENECIWND